MSALVEFLRARLDEDGDQLLELVRRQSKKLIVNDAVLYRRALEPRKLLADVESKRRVIDLHPIYRGPRIQGVDSRWCDFGCELCHSTSRIDDDSLIEAIGYCETLLALAQPYADHPDFDPEWKL
jgi:hypothetical protein